MKTSFYSKYEEYEARLAQLLRIGKISWNCLQNLIYLIKNTHWTTLKNTNRCSFWKKTLCYFSIFYALILVIIHGPEVSFFCVCSIDEERGRCLFGAKNPMLVLLFAQFLRICTRSWFENRTTSSMKSSWREKKPLPLIWPKNFVLLLQWRLSFISITWLLFLALILDVNKVL